MISKVLERKDLIMNFIYEEETRERSRLSGEKYKNTFTRDRKIPLPDLILLTLNKQGKTTSFEIRDYEINKKGGTSVSYTDEAYLKQRRILNPEVFKEANKIYLESFYNDEDNNIIKNKDYIVCAVDGSQDEVPNTPENRKHFGTPKSQNETQPARALFSSLYDINNHFYLDVIVDKCTSGEIELAKANIEQAMKVIGTQKLLIIFDRAYPSLEFFIWLEKRNIKYLVRLKKKDYKKEKSQMIDDDSIVDIVHTKSRSQIILKKYPEIYDEYLKSEKTTVRFTKVKFSTNQEEYLASNISKDEFSSVELKELYSLRWGIEESYDSIKNKLKIESFTGNLPQFVYQDIYAQTVVYNQIQDMLKLSNKELEEINKTKTLKHSYQVNENKAIGIFKEKFIKIMINGDNPDDYEEMIKEMASFVSVIRKDRQSQPRKWNCKNRYRTNLKASF